MSALQWVSYVAVVFFVVAVAVKMIRIARMPVHLRWDLYPIPHERGKGHYGGSYFEEIDWWTKPRDFALMAELTEMAKEIILVKGVYRHNRPLWYFSFPFHFGLYCLVGFTVVLVVGAIMQAAGVTVAANAGNGFAVLVHYATVVLGYAGWILSLIGGVGVLLKRMTNRDMRAATVRGDYLNLVFLLAVFVTGLLSLTTVEQSLAIWRGFVGSLITFQAAGPLPTMLSVHLWLVVILLLYFPFTHMTHMVGKYFTYHTVRWEDEPNIRDGHIERAVQKALGYKINWSAPHIKSGSTWAEAATSTEEEKKDE